MINYHLSSGNQRRPSLYLRLSLAHVHIFLNPRVKIFGYLKSSRLHFIRFKPSFLQHILNDANRVFKFEFLTDFVTVRTNRLQFISPVAPLKGGCLLGWSEFEKFSNLNLLLWAKVAFIISQKDLKIFWKNINFLPTRIDVE